VHGENIVVRFNGKRLSEATIRVCELSPQGVGQGVLLQKSRVTRVKPISFLKISFALVPFTTTPRNVGQHLGDLTGVWEELLRLLKIAQRSVVVLEAGIIIVAFAVHRLTKLWLQGKGSLGSAPGFLAQRRCPLHCSTDVAGRIHATKERPGDRELGIEPHCVPEVLLRRERVCRNVSASHEERETS